MRLRNALLSWSVLGAVAAAPAVAQEQTAPPVTEASIQELIEKLGAEAYRTRQGAEASLEEIGESAMEALRNAAENHADEEVRWRARRLLQKLERGDAPGLRLRDAQDPQPPGHPAVPGVTPDLDRVFERLFADLERNFGLDIPRTRFFEDDFFKGLDGQMGELQRELQDRMRGQTFGPGWNFDSSSQSVSVKIGPEGVRLEIGKQNEAGEPETEVYEAPDLESFREQYPELAEQYLAGGGGLRAFTLQPGARGFLQLGPGTLMPQNLTPRTLRLAPRGTAVIPDVGRDLIPLDPRGGVVGAPPPPPEGRRLGVLVVDVPPEVGRYLGLDEGQGLLVQEVEDGGLASALGVQAGDIVLQIGGEEIRVVQDVARALGSIEAGETVEVKVNRRGQEVELQAEKRKSAVAPALRIR